MNYTKFFRDSLLNFLGISVAEDATDAEVHAAIEPYLEKLGERLETQAQAQTEQETEIKALKSGIAETERLLDGAIQRIAKLETKATATHTHLKTQTTTTATDADEKLPKWKEMVRAFDGR